MAIRFLTRPFLLIAPSSVVLALAATIVFGQPSIVWALTVVPIVVMGVYLMMARRLGAFEAL